jgi:hypothetical protein
VSGGDLSENAAAHLEMHTPSKLGSFERLPMNFCHYPSLSKGAVDGRFPSRVFVWSAGLLGLLVGQALDGPGAAVKVHSGTGAATCGGWGARNGPGPVPRQRRRGRRLAAAGCREASAASLATRNGVNRQLC